MRSRPQPNPRRGILRAAIAVILLVALLVVVILAVSSLTAPTAKAPSPTVSVPTPPPTPGPNATPHLNPTRTPTHGPAATPSATKKKGLSVGPDMAGRPLAETSPSRLYAPAVGAARQVPPNATLSNDGRLAAYFDGGGDAYSGKLDLVDTSSGARTSVGNADPYVRPVWSQDNRYLLYVRVVQTRAFPDAHWSLLRLDTRSHRVDVVARANAMTLIPLGWSGRRLLYLVGNSTDTSLFARTARRSEFVSIVMAQPLTTATLAPNGRYIALGAPTTCYALCTLDIFDVHRPATWIGPTGMPDEFTLAWTDDGETVVTILKGRLATIQADTHATHFYSIPASLPRSWRHPMRAAILSDGLRLTDTITGRTYQVSS